LAVLKNPSTDFPVLIFAKNPENEFNSRWIYIYFCEDNTCSTYQETIITSPGAGYNSFATVGHLAATYLSDGSLFIAHHGGNANCGTNDFISLWGPSLNCQRRDF
jgi:hypothetical protein